MQSRIVLLAFSLAIAGLGGCASLRPREAFPGVAQQVQDRTGARVVWNEAAGPDASVEAALNTMLANELTADSAVQVALLNNRSIQATYEDLGIAQAELVQAGLLTNPVFSALLRFPDGGGSPNLELSVSQNFIELLTQPLRKKIAAAQYETAKARVANEVVSLAADVRKHFYALQADEQMLELRRSIVDSTAASSDAAQKLREAGNTTELAVMNQQALYGQARLDLTRAEAEAVKDWEMLASLLGLWDSPANLRLTSRLPELPSEDPDVKSIESSALHQRLDFIAATRELDATYQSLGLTQRFNWFNSVELTVDGEHELDGGWVTGPGISVPIPLFDTGAAQTSVAAARVRQARDRIHVLAVQIRSEARSAAAQMRSARERVAFYQSTVVPLRQKITQQTQLQYNAMSVGVFQLLESKRQEIDAGRDYIEALRDYWLARAELERAAGGMLLK